MLLKRTALTAVLIIIVLSSILTGCNTGAKDTTTAAPTTVAAETWYQRVAYELKAIQPGEVPANLIPADGVKNGTEFDINTIFSVLTHLSIQEGYVLDYVFLSDGTAGGPILYICPADAVPFKTYEEYRQATHDHPRPDNNVSMIWLVKGAETTLTGNKIKTDGTKEGFFEYALFQTLANQFYLFGGALVNDKQVVAESSLLEDILDEIENSKDWTPIDSTFKKEARKIDLQPFIQISDPNVLVQMVLFTKWGGFSRVSILMNRDYPHTIISNSIEPILEYNCGIMPQALASGGN